MLRRGAILTLAMATILSGGTAARAQDPGNRGVPGDGDQRKIEQSKKQQLSRAEEDMLRGQLENAINETAHWDAEKKRIVLKDAKRLGPMAMFAYGLIARLAEPGEDGRLHIRKGVRLRPFMQVIQDFINDGGLEDLQKLERVRQGGGGSGENPFKDGIPPRVAKLVGGLMGALNTMGQPGPDGDDEKDERVADKEKESEKQAPGEASSDIRKRIAERLNMDPQDLDKRIDQALATAEKAGTAVVEKARAFAESDRGRRLLRRAESEVRRIAESEEFQKQIADLKTRAEEFMKSEQGQELQRKAMEYFFSPDGQKLQKRVQDFLQSERGREIQKAIEKALGGRGGQGDGARPPRPSAGEDEKAKKARDKAKYEEFRDSGPDKDAHTPQLKLF